ncbi:MAG: M48 family metallopeptidase, partial [Desulfobulbaceae bacterium]|nr:M48 family metallopeptidase [Desulfobulbaceae bacterium]
AQTRARLQFIDSGPAIDKVKAIGERLTPDTRHHYQWFVAESPEINAFAAPGGVVVVFSGLIRATASPEELAGVLAHEVSHAELRHSLKGAVKNLGLRSLMLLAMGDLSAGLLGDLAAGLTEMKFSRDAEREADREAVKRLAKAHIDPNAMVTFFELLERENRPTPPAILSTHPATRERIDTVRREISLMPRPAPRPLAMNWQAVKDSLPAEKMAKSP